MSNIQIPSSNSYTGSVKKSGNREFLGLRPWGWLILCLLTLFLYVSMSRAAAWKVFIIQGSSFVCCGLKYGYKVGCRNVASWRLSITSQVTSNWAVSAGHCFTDNSGSQILFAGEVRLVLGDHDRSNKESSLRYGAMQWWSWSSCRLRFWNLKFVQHTRGIFVVATGKWFLSQPSSSTPILSIQLLKTTSPCCDFTSLPTWAYTRLSVCLSLELTSLVARAGCTVSRHFLTYPWCIAPGWGWTEDQGDEYSNTLQEVEVWHLTTSYFFISAVTHYEKLWGLTR